MVCPYTPPWWLGAGAPQMRKGRGFELLSSMDEFSIEEEVIRSLSQIVRSE